MPIASAGYPGKTESVRTLSILRKRRSSKYKYRYYEKSVELSPTQETFDYW